MQPIERKHLRVRPLATLGDQKSEVYRLTFSPDGTLLISDGAKTCFWRGQYTEYCGKGKRLVS